MIPEDMSPARLNWHRAFAFVRNVSGTIAAVIFVTVGSGADDMSETTVKFGVKVFLWGFAIFIVSGIFASLFSAKKD